MSERGEQVRKVLDALSKHAELIAEGFEGAVLGGDKQRDAGIEALYRMGVLKPYEEGEYRLNPLLRDFLAENLSNYHALQALRNVIGPIQEAGARWQEMLQLRRSGSMRDFARMAKAFDFATVDIAHAIEHNLERLHNLLSTQYGNVEDLRAKVRQNRYYAGQVRSFLQHVQRIDTLVETVSADAVAYSLLEYRHMVIKRLASRQLQWTSQIKDAQTQISSRLFEAKLMELRLSRLARFSMWLSQHKTEDGWEVPVDESTDLAMLRPDTIEVRPQPDVQDVDQSIQDTLVGIVTKMPLAKRLEPPREPPPPQMIIEDEKSEPVVELNPLKVMFRELIESIELAQQPLSLREWKRGRPDLAQFTDGAFLMFLIQPLRKVGMELTYVWPPDPDPFPINEPFHDIQVQWVARKRA